MTMLEKLATAIRQADLEGSESGVLWETRLARAALMAMREPTDEMIDAAVEVYDHEGMSNSTDVWGAMIDAILEETK